MTFLVWDAANGTEEDGTEEVKATRPEYAAERFVETNHSDLDYPEEIEIGVRAPDGEVTRWKVTAQPTVEFRARPVGGSDA